jgi:peptide/nickel transport system substrate-binding protein
MKKDKNAAALFALSFLLGLAGLNASAAAEDKCVRVVSEQSSGEKASMDPALQPTNDDAYHLFAVYNRFLDTDDNFNVVPALAQSWKSSSDGKQWTFKLQPGVKFHDGKDFGAKDVVYTFRRLIDPATVSPAAALLPFLKPDGIQAVDPLTVQFTTDKPIAELPLLLTLKFNLVVEDGATTAQLKVKEYGTGPFVQEKFAVGNTDRILRRNTNYWKSGLPKSDCIHISVISDPLAALASIESNRVDLLFNVAPTAVTALKNNQNVKLLSTGAGTSWSLAMEIDKPPFDKIQVRQALKAVVDRQAMVDTVLLGLGEVGNDNPVPPSWDSAYTHDVPKPNIDHAKKLLAEAGYPSGIDVDLYTAEAAPGMLNFTAAFQQMAAPAGIRVHLVSTPADSYWDQIWLQRPFFAGQWAIRPPAEGLAVAYTKDAKWNETHWYRDDYDSLLAQSKIEFDPARRADLYKQAQKMLTEQGGIIIPMFTHQVVAIRKECNGYQPHAQSFRINYETIVCKE